MYNLQFNKKILNSKLRVYWCYIILPSILTIVCGANASFSKTNFTWL